MSGYSVYNPIRSSMLSVAGQAFDKKERKRADFHKRVISEVFLNSPDLMQTIDARILAEEVVWQDAGCPMYFSETPELLDMLWRAKVNVRIEDLELGKMSRAFAFAWPKCLVDGIQPMGCLIWWGEWR